MFTPREVQTFIRMLDVLSDPAKAKAIAVDLEAKARQADAKLTSIDEREDAVARREARCKSIEENEKRNDDAFMHANAVLAEHEAQLLTQRDQCRKDAQQNADRSKALDEQAAFLMERGEKLNGRDARLAELELRMETKAKELDQKIAEVNDQKARLKEIVG